MASGGIQSNWFDIKTNDVPVNIDRVPLQLDYSLNHCKVLKKIPEGWILLPGTDQQQLSYGPLKNSYRLYQIHGHTNGDQLGSCRRHYVDGKKYAGELHLLHYDPLMNYSPNEFPNTPPDYKVYICLLLKEGKINNELSKIAKGLDVMTTGLHRTEKIALEDDVDLTLLLPGNLAYWMYKEETKRKGENKKETIWIIFKQPIEASEEQINAMCSPYGRTIAAQTIPPESEMIISEGFAILKPSDS